MASEKNLEHLPRIEALARLMDNVFTIPGTNIRFGLDPIIGLIPGVGDAAGGFVSAYIVVVAAQLGAPPIQLARMILNILIESLFGVVPILGDLFDFAWKANKRNIEILKNSQCTASSKPADKRLLFAVIIVLALVVAFSVLVTGSLVLLLVSQV